MDATWGHRELPVLEAVISALDIAPVTSEWPDAADIAAKTGLSLSDVGAALQALNDHYITLVKPLTLPDWHVTAVTQDARRAVGQWPSGESFVEQLAAGIGEAAEREADPERKGRLQAVARGLAGAARQIAVNVASTYLERGLPRA